MTDNKEKIDSQPDNGPRVNVDAVASAQEKTIPQNNDKMSEGEDVFNKGTYFGLNYLTNLISSIAIADYFINPESKGHANLNKTIARCTSALTKMGVSLKTAHHNSKVGLETLALTSGGLILLAPLKWMEDHKRKTVHKLNKALGVDQTGPDGKELTPEQIYIEQEQPKQSWANVIWRRVLGTAAVVVTGLGVDHLARDKNTILPPETYDVGFAKVTYDAKVLGGKERITGKVFDAIDNVAEKVNGSKFKTNGRVSRWTKLLILDSVFTVITAGVMKITNGAKKGKMPKEIDNTNHPKVIRDIEDNLVTEQEVASNNKVFSDKIENRVQCLIDAKREKDSEQNNSSFAQKEKDRDPAAAAYINKIKGDEKAHASAAAFIDKIKTDNMSPAIGV